MILTFELANQDPMNVVEVLKTSQDNEKNVLEHTWEYLNPAGFEVRGWVQIYKQNGGGRGVDNFPR